MASPNLPGLFQAVTPYLDQYGYFAVLVFVLLENFGLPLPGETVMVAAAAYAGAGRLNVFVLAAVVFAAAVIGDNIGFWIGRKGGERLVLRYGRHIFLTPKRLLAIQGFFNRRGGLVVLFARFVAGLRQFNGLVAGTAEMSWPRFLVFNALGAAAWVAVWVSVGYFAGSSLVMVYHQLGNYEWYALILLVLVAAGFVGHRLTRKYRA